MRSTDYNTHQGIKPDSYNTNGNRATTLSSAPIHLKHEKKKKNRTTALVVNPTSAGGSTGKAWDAHFARIRKIFSQDTEIVFTEKSGDGTSLTRDLLKRGFQRIVAIGGDGTINEVANGFFMSIEKGKERTRNRIKFNDLRTTRTQDRFPRSPLLVPINSEAIMGLLPSGTRNVLAKSLDLPEDIVQCCNNFIVGKSKKIDVISATVSPSRDAEGPNVNSKPITRIFLNAAELGVAAEIIDRSKKVRNKVKNRLVSTVTSLAITLPYYESNLCEVSIDNGRENIITKMTMCVIANGRYLGGGFKPAPKAIVSDGLLDIVILKDSGSLKMLDDFINIKDGDYASEPDILYRQAKKVSIKSRERDVTVAIDGEPIGILPATFKVLKGALNIRI
ncbi:MAG: diacylglycerol kinase family lipid kinase [Thermoproteota archaeon]|nr:diacylglycerol kinase family lipid kinase [Thermoproteota archaeon]